MAPRRKDIPAQRLDLELLGVGIMALALLVGAVMFSSSRHAGFLSFLVRSPFVGLFGSAAPAIPFILAGYGLACFLEWPNAEEIPLVGVAAFLYLTLFASGQDTGFVGHGLHGAIAAAVGYLTGAVLWFFTFILTAALFGVSLKKLIGRAIVRIRAMKWRFSFHLDLHMPQMPTLGGEALTSAKTRRPKVRAALPEAADVPAVIETPVYPHPDFDGDDEPFAPPRRPGPPALVDFSPRPSGNAGAVDVRSRPIPSIHEEMVWSADDDAMIESRIVSGDEPQRKLTYTLPPLNLFDPPSAQLFSEDDRKNRIIEVLHEFGVDVTINTEPERGPSITRYELVPKKGVKIARIKALTDDLTLALKAVSIRIEAPIPGKGAVGLEVPNSVVSVVAIREILEALPARGVVAPLPMALGKDIAGQPVYGDLSRMPHLLVAGATGAGKSVCLNNIIASLLATATPDQVQILMIDPKRVELTVYNGIPHLIKEVITDARMAAGALFEMTKEMDSRYERFAKVGVRKIEEYNAKFLDEQLPYVVIIIDELADLMLVAPAKVETTIMRLAQLARATGIHLIVATQRPSVDVITGIIKANIPSRIAFAVSSQVDSRTILDMAGAERLLGRGDMLFLPIDASKPKRAQGAYITGEEVTRLVEFWAAQARPKNLLEVDVVPIDDEGDENRGLDPISFDAAKFIIETNFASTAQLQAQFQIGHPRAVRVMKGLEDMKVVGPHEGTKPRKILIGLGDLDLMAPRFNGGRGKPEPYADGTIPDELGG